MTPSIALIGAGGKMGCRITDQLADDPAYDLRCVEPSDTGIHRLKERGVSTTPRDEALTGADVVIMAVPDRLLGSILADLVPELEAETMVMLLDPAAAYAGLLPEREDIAYFITHPCHPPLFSSQTDPNEPRDWFGGQGLAEQDIVCALHQGNEEDYARGEAIARDLYAPVEEAYRLSTEQMAILEPQLVEALLSTCLYALREGMDKTIEMGVPEEAARSFMLGHLRTEIAIVFDEAGFPLSDGAQQIAAETKDDLFQPNWKAQLFDTDRVRESTKTIVDAE